MRNEEKRKMKFILVGTIDQKDIAVAYLELHKILAKK